MLNTSVLFGALRYEFQMQVQRRAVWVVILALGALVFFAWYRAERYLPQRYQAFSPAWVTTWQLTAVMFFAQIITMLIPVGVGLVMADRLARDHTTRMNEIFDTLPGPLAARLLGKYLGSTLATLLPVTVVYLAGISFVLYQQPDFAVFPLAIEAFLSMLLPAIVFVAAFSVAVPAVLKVPLYQVLFVGYWFWANLMNPGYGIPTVSPTILNAAGSYASEGLFQFHWNFVRTPLSTTDAIASITLILCLACVGLTSAWWYLRWQQAQR